MKYTVSSLSWEFLFTRYSNLDFIFFDKRFILKSQFSFQDGCSAPENKASVFEIFALVLRREIRFIHSLLGSSQVLTSFPPVSDQV